MGYGAYSHDRHREATTHRAAGASFRASGLHPLMNPRGLVVRESRDSEEHPNSVPIIFALDVTGSMGGIPRDLATRSLPTFMKSIIDAGVPDPQVLFLAVGDAVHDRAPLQVGQFESSDELMDQWLTNVWIESGGGPGTMESYELAFHFAARHTSTDAWERREQRGYLFVTGDENPWPAVTPEAIAAIYGDALEAEIPTEDIVAEARERWNCFFLIPRPERVSVCGERWAALLGPACIVFESPDDIALGAASLVALTERTLPSLEALEAHLVASGSAPERAAAIARALRPWAESLPPA